MTREFLASIGLVPLDEFIQQNAEIGADTATQDFYRLVLQRTDETILGLFESFVGVFKNSSALNLVSNLLKWASDSISTVTETLSARAEARAGLGG